MSPIAKGCFIIKKIVEQIILIKLMNINIISIFFLFIYIKK